MEMNSTIVFDIDQPDVTSIQAPPSGLPVISVCDLRGQPLGCVHKLSFDAFTGRIDFVWVKLNQNQQILTLPWDCFIQDTHTDSLMINTGLKDLIEQQNYLLH